MAETKQRDPKVGDRVIVRCWYCEVNGQSGEVISIAESGSMPVMVRLDNYREWSFEPEELEINTYGED